MKKILALLLVCAMLISTLTACSSKETKGSQNQSDGGNTSTGSNASAETGRPSDHVTLKMYFHGSNVSDDSQVMAKVNEYLDEKLNVTLEPI